MSFVAACFCQGEGHGVICWLPAPVGALAHSAHSTHSAPGRHGLAVSPVHPACSCSAASPLCLPVRAFRAFESQLQCSFFREVAFVTILGSRGLILSASMLGNLQCYQVLSSALFGLVWVSLWATYLALCIAWKLWEGRNGDSLVHRCIFPHLLAQHLSRRAVAEWVTWLLSWRSSTLWVADTPAHTVKCETVNVYFELHLNRPITTTKTQETKNPKWIQ